MKNLPQDNITWSWQDRATNLPQDSVTWSWQDRDTNLPQNSVTWSWQDRAITGNLIFFQCHGGGGDIVHDILF